MCVWQAYVYIYIYIYIYMSIVELKNCPFRVLASCGIFRVSSVPFREIASPEKDKLTFPEWMALIENQGDATLIH